MDRPAGNRNESALREKATCQRAKARAEAKLGFFRHAAIAGGISLVLAGINLATSPGNLWFWWVVLALAIGIAIRAVKTFGGPKPEEIKKQMIAKELEKEKNP
jgi:uncharacterized membrane protein YdbT with pleckstrin-like domain